jgi:hypothetical protein
MMPFRNVLFDERSQPVKAGVRVGHGALRQSVEPCARARLRFSEARHGARCNFNKRFLRLSVKACRCLLVSVTCAVS